MGLLESFEKLAVGKAESAGVNMLFSPMVLGMLEHAFPWFHQKIQEKHPTVCSFFFALFGHIQDDKTMALSILDGNMIEILKIAEKNLSVWVQQHEKVNG